MFVIEQTDEGKPNHLQIPKCQQWTIINIAFNKFLSSTSIIHAKGFLFSFTVKNMKITGINEQNYKIC